MKSYTMHYSFYCSTLLLSGCAKVADWAQCNFNQAHNNSSRVHIQKAQSYIRSVGVYDQFTTNFLCTVLWLSDDVCDTYNRMCAFKQGRGPVAQPWWIENKQIDQIAFIVMSNQPLGIDDTWFSLLEIDHCLYQPTMIMPITLPPEIEMILGDSYRYRHYRQSYCVTFSTGGSYTDKPIMHLRSGLQSICFRWDNTCIDPHRFSGQCVMRGKERERIL